MKQKILFLAVALLPAAALAHGESGAKSELPLPPNVKTLGSAQETQVRELPPEFKSKLDKETVSDTIVGATATDTIYSTNKSYRETIAFFDKHVKSGGTEQQMKLEVPSATAYRLKLRDGEIANVIVRNTTPTTIETVEAAAAELKMKGTEEMPPSKHSTPDHHTMPPSQQQMPPSQQQMPPSQQQMPQ
jgi:hypothetical protein